MRSATAKACAITWVMIMTPMPRRAHAVDGLEAAAGLLDAERREGLVEHHQLAAPVHEAVELDRLALAAGQMLDGGSERRDAGAAGLERAAGLGLHLPLLQQRHAEDAARQLAAHEEVGHHVDVGAEREVLVDRLDPRCLCVGGRGEVPLGAVVDRRGPRSAAARRR